MLECPRPNTGVESQFSCILLHHLPILIIPPAPIPPVVSPKEDPWPGLDDGETLFVL